MTSEGLWELRVDLGDWDGSSAFATYSGFRIASEADGYRLHFDNFTGGTAGKPSLVRWNLESACQTVESLLRQNIESARQNADSLC